jgi:hypothetical protein
VGVHGEIFDIFEIPGTNGECMSSLKLANMKLAGIFNFPTSKDSSLRLNSEAQKVSLI